MPKAKDEHERPEPEHRASRPRRGAARPAEKASETATVIWPALEEQLGRATARPGSKLDRLIRDNQEFDMLSPSEADDGLPFPPWLRVYWRKSHPELDFRGPRVGYPLLLERVLEWMLSHQDLSEAMS
jgi:hypothetical protein